MRDGAIGAVPRAYVAEDHERRRAVFPAFPDVRTMRLFANRVQIEIAHQLLELEVLRAAWRADLEPARLSLRKGLNAVTTSYLVQCVAHEPRGEILDARAWPSAVKGAASAGFSTVALRSGSR